MVGVGKRAVKGDFCVLDLVLQQHTAHQADAHRAGGMGRRRANGDGAQNIKQSNAHSVTLSASGRVISNKIICLILAKFIPGNLLILL
jgi:hypothetical protein